MGKTTGFLEYPRRGPSHRPVAVRLRDWREVYEPQSDDDVSTQGARCMDCGIPFCMQGCPLGNRIPTFNDHVYRSHWEQAAAQLFDTNNFPEFTGRLCPAPCESACVLGISDSPITIERIEYEVAEHAFAHGFDVALVPASRTGKRVAVAGSGPAGLAAAAQLASVGHDVHVFERSDAVGGLLRYGIPEFKLEKAILDRRLAVMVSSGITFHTNVCVGDATTPLSSLQRDFDAVLLALGSTRHRLIPVPGAQLLGVYPAMTYLEAANRAVRDAAPSPIDARDLHVIILGGGDTIDAVKRLGFKEEQFTFVSTGGGAMLEFLEGKMLPGVEVLLQKTAKKKAVSKKPARKAAKPKMKKKLAKKASKKKIQAKKKRR